MSDSFFNIPIDISDSIRAFQSEVDSLSHSFKLIESFAGDYFMTLSQSGFKQLNDIVDALNHSLSFSDRLIRAKRFDDARDVLNYIYNNKGTGSKPSILQNELAQILPLLENWSDQVRNLIDSIDKNIKEASKKYKDVGVVRKRNREPTSLILGEVRKKVFGGPSTKSKKLPTF